MKGEIEVDSKKVSVRAKPKQDESVLIRQYKEKFGELLDFTPEQVSRIKKTLRKELNDWESDRSGLNEKLQLWYDLENNIVKDEDLPFDGAVNNHINITRIFSKIYFSIESRSILGSDDLWYAETDSWEEEENAEVSGTMRKVSPTDQFLPSIEKYFNYKARTDWNIKNEFLPACFKLTNRDSVCAGQIDYDIETEKVEDVVVISGEQDFYDEFPDPETSGLSEKEWRKLLKKAVSSTEDRPLEVPVEYENITYLGPRGHPVELANFLVFPATAADIRRTNCRGYGKQFRMRKTEIKRKVSEGLFYEDEAQKLLTNKVKGSELNSYEKNRLYSQGLSRTGDSDDFLLNEVVYWFDPDNDGVERKFVFVYEKDKNVLLSAKYYIYRVNNIVLFRIDPQTGSLVGWCIPEEVVDLDNEISAMHNQRINSRKITEVPSFKGKASRKADFDANAEENKWRPGVTFWLEDPDTFAQLVVQPVDLGTSIQEEEKDLRYCSLLLGVDPFTFSGQAQAEDPDAPGNKTAMLINQGNLRMEEPLNELRKGVSEVGNICVALEYQFGKNIIEFRENRKSPFMSFPKRLLRKGIKLNMHPVTVQMNADSNLMKELNLHKLRMSEPTIAQSIGRRTQSLKDVFRQGRVPDYEKYFPTEEEMKKEEVMLRVQALQVMKQQQMEQIQKQRQSQPDPKALADQEIAQREQRKKEVVGAIEGRAKEMKSVKNLIDTVTGGEK